MNGLAKSGKGCIKESYILRASCGTKPGSIQDYTSDKCLGWVKNPPKRVKKVISAKWDNIDMTSTATCPSETGTSGYKDPGSRD